jgi:hypothetical protein
MAAPERYASHWLLPAKAPTPPGYRPFETFGAYRIVRREHDPIGGAQPTGYATTTSGLLGVAPKVTPRW